MITLRVDMTGLTESITSFQDQIPFATSVALNRLANAVQDTERAGISQRFTIRRPWVLQGIKIENRDRATKRLLQVTVGVDAQRSFLSKFEIGGLKVPIGSSHAIAVPEIGVRPSVSAIIPTSKRPRAFSFARRAVRHTSDFAIFEGAQRTFLIQRPDGSGLIFQRTGGAASRKGRVRGQQQTANHGADPNLVLLYVLAPSVKIPPELEFYATAERVVSEQFASIFAKAFDEAKATAR